MDVMRLPVKILLFLLATINLEYILFKIICMHVITFLSSISGETR